jgi:hypothetical protein
MNNAPLHRGAYHEAGHAVMARVLGVNLECVRIDIVDPHAGARTCAEATSPQNTILIAAAGDACLRAFGYVTMHDDEALGDEVAIGNALSELEPDDEDSYPQRRLDAIAEVERRFEQPNVRAAVEALVEALMREGKIEGPGAAAIVDRHLLNPRVR